MHARSKLHHYDRSQPHYKKKRPHDWEKTTSIDNDFLDKAWKERYFVASFPVLPRFSSSVCIQYNTRKRKSAKNEEGLGSFIT